MAERYKHIPVCQDCGNRGAEVKSFSPVPSGTPHVPGRCPTPINGQPNTLPHRVKWETCKLN